MWFSLINFRQRQDTDTTNNTLLRYNLKLSIYLPNGNPWFVECKTR